MTEENINEKIVEEQINNINEVHNETPEMLKENAERFEKVLKKSNTGMIMDVVENNVPVNEERKQAVEAAITNEQMAKLMAMRKVRTQIREYPKIGRNDECPCGSGKKYKNCCLPTGKFTKYKSK